MFQPHWCRHATSCTTYSLPGSFRFRCVGDINSKLDALEHGAAPEDPTAFKIFQLLKVGFCRESLVEGLRLLARLPWSTKTTEEAHCAAAVVMRHHKQLGEDTLLSRAVVLQARPLFSKSVEQKRFEAAQAKLQRLERKHLKDRR